MADARADATSIELTRRKTFSFALQKLRVFVDDQQLAQLSNGEQVSLVVEPGLHSIKVKARLALSGAVEVSVPSGETLHLWCAPSGQSIQVAVEPSADEAGAS